MSSLKVFTQKSFHPSGILTDEEFHLYSKMAKNSHFTNPNSQFAIQNKY